VKAVLDAISTNGMKEAGYECVLSTSLSVGTVATRVHQYDLASAGKLTLAAGCGEQVRQHRRLLAGRAVS
jgi:hypothetical protein